MEEGVDPKGVSLSICSVLSFKLPLGSLSSGVEGDLFYAV